MDWSLTSVCTDLISFSINENASIGILVLMRPTLVNLIGTALIAKPTKDLRISNKLRSAASALKLLPGTLSFNALFKSKFS